MAAADARYDTIGIDYAARRKADPRIANMIEDALGPAQSILNVGAGTGSYEPAGRLLTAVEPSIAMIRQRSPRAAKAIQASAEALPFPDDSFDARDGDPYGASLADKEAGLREMRRVTRGRIVLLTFDPARRPWLTDYLPELATLDEAQMPAMADYERWLEPVRVLPRAGAARLQRRFPARLLAPARCLSGCPDSRGQLILLGHRQCRRRIGQAGARSRNRRMGATLSRAADAGRL